MYRKTTKKGITKASLYIYAIISIILLNFTHARNENHGLELDKSIYKFQTTLNQKKDIDSNFKLFYKKFNNDYKFQLSRLLFLIKIISTGEKDSITFINKNQWHKITLKEKYVKYIVLEKDKIERINVQYSVQDTGILINHYFEKIEGKWFLTSIKDESD